MSCKHIFVSYLIVRNVSETSRAIVDQEGQLHNVTLNNSPYLIAYQKLKNTLTKNG